MKPYCLYLFALFSVQGAFADWKPVPGTLLTPWGAKIETNKVWQEYPRPQLRREGWTNLNGLWDYRIVRKGGEDAAAMAEFGSGGGNGEGTAEAQILVPFCAESALSGVGRLVGPDEALWYRRELLGGPLAGKRTLLHFEAVDHEAVVWVNGTEVARHVGGFSPFSCDITAALKEKGNTLTVRVHDATEGWQVRGKQALKPHGITYTRVTGIWQTVWLEQVPERYVADLDFETVVEGEKPEVRTQKQEARTQKQEARVQKQENRRPGAGDGVRDRGERAGKLEKEGTTGVSLRVNAKLAGKAVKGESLRVTVSFGGEEVAAAKGGEKVSIPIPQPRWWTPEHPNLYDLKVELLDGGGKVLDTVSSYSALRTVGKVRDARGHLRLAINGEEVFLLGPLDQGWWPGGLLTPPSDEAMKASAAPRTTRRSRIRFQNSIRSIGPDFATNSMIRMRMAELLRTAGTTFTFPSLKQIPPSSPEEAIAIDSNPNPNYVMFLRFTSSIFLPLLVSCMVLPEAGPGRNGMSGIPNENHAAAYPDFTFEAYQNIYKGRGLVMRYKVGDRFRLRKPMFLSFSSENIVQLRDIDASTVPPIHEYKRNPEAYRFGGDNLYQVIKLVRAGTVIEIVKIAPVIGAVPYFRFQGGADWFRSSIFSKQRNLEYSAERIVLERTYNKKFFEKL